MKILMPCDWKSVDLLTTENANDFGEALRSHCFIGKGCDTGCYSTFQVSSFLEEIREGKIFEEAKKYLYEDIKPIVYYYKLKKEDCYIENYLAFNPYEIICAWSWDGDGCLYFRFNNRKVVNTDCKCDYTWEWVE